MNFSKQYLPGCGGGGELPVLYFIYCNRLNETEINCVPITGHAKGFRSKRVQTAVTAAGPLRDYAVYIAAIRLRAINYSFIIIVIIILYLIRRCDYVQVHLRFAFGRWSWEYNKKYYIGAALHRAALFPREKTKIAETTEKKKG